MYEISSIVPADTWANMVDPTIAKMCNSSGKSCSFPKELASEDQDNDRNQQQLFYSTYDF
jgi:hypothetical protein